MLDFKVSPGVRQGFVEAPTDALIKVDERTFTDIVSGKVSPEFAFMRGKIRVKGNTSAALRIKSLIAAVNSN